MLIRYVPSGGWGRSKRASPRSAVIKLLGVLLVLWLLYLLLMLVRHAGPLGEPPAAPEPEALPIPQPPSYVPETAMNKPEATGLSGIDHWDQDPAKVRAADARRSRSDLVLRGIFSSSDPHLSHAIIADPSGGEGYYRIGDVVQDGSVVHEILGDKVILARNENYETLNLVPDEDKNTAMMENRVTSTDPDGRESSAARVVFKQNPKSLIDLVDPRPVRMNGRFMGFKLKALKNSNRLREFGLRQDDIVTWVNEVDLDNPLKGIRTLRSIASGDYVNMTVRRNGQDISLSFNVP